MVSTTDANRSASRLADIGSTLKNLVTPQSLAIRLLSGLVCVALFSTTALAEPTAVNVNSADAAAIAEALDGVGMSRAEAIVEYRHQHGAFADAYDLANVKGIGDRTIELNEDRIRLKD
jgi:competence protein ComEA